MGFPLFRFTLNNTIEGSKVISEPGGWDDSILKLERNEEFHSLVEFYDQPMTFYGADNENDGGLDYIRTVEQSQGVDAQITILVEISNDEGDTYETAFEGLLDLSTLKEIDFYKLECGIIRNDFWSKFINRKGTTVDLSSTTDLDGGTRSAIGDITLSMPSQVIRQNLAGRIDENLSFGAYNASNFIQIDNTVDDVNEIMEKFTLPTYISTNTPVNIIEVLYDGEYEFDINFELSRLVYVAGNLTQVNVTDTYVDFLIKKNDDSPITFTAANVINTGSPADPSLTRYTYTGTLSLIKGDLITIYGDITTLVEGLIIWGTNGLSITIAPDTIPFPDGATGSWINAIANTTYPDTETDAFLLHDAGESVLSKIIGRDNVLISEYLGENSPEGCAKDYALMKGLHVRGYSFADKPFFMSFDQWWQGANPILNLGLGYTKIGGTEYIEVEKKEEFYNPATSLNLDFVNNIEREYDEKKIFKSIEIGYEKWSAESASGVDDPQTKRTYRTRFKTMGSDARVLSKFVAASLAIEQTRRNRVEQGKDWRLDEEIMIIAINQDASPIQPEFSENFASITGLLNEDYRYNIRLSTARNFERWKNVFNGCLQTYIPEDYVFSGGEGNYDMTSQLEGTDCEALDVSPEPIIDEKGDPEVSTDFLFIPIVYNFEHPLTWEEYTTIRDNRKNAIGVSRTDTDHKACFILNLEYQPTKGKGKFTVILGENDPL